MGKTAELTGWLMFSSVTVALGSSLLYGYNMAKLNTPSEIIKQFFNDSYTRRSGQPVTPETLGLLWSVTMSIYVGFGAIGSFSSGWLADRIGRKKALLLNHVLAIIGSTLEAICKTTGLPELLMAGRALNGLNCGLTLGLASMYLSEISPQSIRGAISNMSQVGIVLGILLAQILGISHLLGTESRWPYLLACTALTPILSCIALPFCPESPRYLMLNKNDEIGARKVMRMMHKDLMELESAIEDMRKEVQASSDAINRFRYLDLFKTRRLRIALMICLALMVCQQWSGINAIFAFSGMVFTDAGIAVDHVQYAIIATGVANVLLTFVNLPLMERAGRRSLLLYPSIVMVASLVLLTPIIVMQKSIPWLSYLSVIFTITYIVGFALGLGPIPIMITSEVFRQGPRGAAVGFVQATHWAMNFIVTFTFTIMKMKIGAFVFLVYSVICTVCIVFVLLFLPETMGRSLDEITSDLRRGYMARPCMPPLYLYDDVIARANAELHTMGGSGTGGAGHLQLGDEEAADTKEIDPLKGYKEDF